MANHFRLATTTLATTNLTTLLTVPATSTYLVGSIIVANTHASSSADLTITITDDSASASVNIATLRAIAIEVPHEILTRPLVLENGDILKFQADTVDVLDITVSYMDRDRTL